MKISKILRLVSLFVGLSCQISQAQVLTPSQARTDLSYLKRKLDLLHPGMGYYTPHARMEQLYDSLYNRLTSPVDYLTFFHHVSPFVAAIKDGHTNLNHRKNYIGKSTRFFPFYIRLVESQYFISHNVSSDTTLQRGTELLAINGRAVADVHDELMNADHSGSDGDNLTGRRQWSLIQFADYYAAWFGSADSIKITYRLADDSLVRQTKLKCLTLDNFRHRIQRRYGIETDRRPNLSVRMVDTLTHTAVLRISTFMGIKKKDPFQWAFNRRLKRAFKQIRQENVQNLVVDMQGNGGGIVMNSAHLLRYWMPKSFRIMDHEEMKKGARAELVTRWNPFSALNFSLQYRDDNRGGFASRLANRRYRPRHRDAFAGNLYFLMNGASFSATTSVLAKTLDAGMGTFVGEASGSAYWGDFAGHFKTVTLPNSKLQVRIPLKKLTHAVETERANGFTVEPDFIVTRSFDDLMHNRDYVLDYTLRLIREGIVVRPGVEKQMNRNRALQASR
ncbi:S41 family peptidase [Spirosoma pollinicola]|uniref:Peptidase S41 n=1 Tax=Spirosoma pollinicola TaxID=2057025 RepID=A0A2K8Z713_9BACT|nr:S41 family peptidase [Spirosoma pollinicola]AUD05609.1 peptidase S41 [Spirosoma pollinicola]